MRRIMTVAIAMLLLIGAPITPIQASAVTSSWVKNNTYGFFADHDAALNEVKNLMRQQTSAYKMERFELILTEFPLSGFFNKSKKSPCAWHCGKCEKRDASSCINSFYDSETKRTIDLKAWQCYGYARYCTYRFFGSTLVGQGISISSTHTSSAENFKKFLSQYSDLTGAHFRANGHSLVYLARDSQYIYFIDANSGSGYSTHASQQCSVNSSHWSTCCKIHLRKMTYSQFVNLYSSVTLYYSDNGSSTNSVTIKNSSTNGTMTVYENNAVVHGAVVKPTSYPITKFGIRIRLTNGSYSNGWSYFHDPKSSYTTKSEVPFWFDFQDELKLTLTHATSYTYQLYSVVNGKEYWGPENTFTTSGSHSYGAWSTAYSPTCTVGGTKRRTCACGAYEDAVIPATGHSYSSTYTVDTAATCTTAGSKSRHCSKCSATTGVTAIPATGHSYGNWATVKNATCVTAGTKQRTCACGAVEKADITALGHKFSPEWTVDKKATCTMAGSKSHHCERCNAVKDVTAILATGHSYGEWAVEKEAAIGQDGLEVRTCSACSAQEKKTILALSEDKHIHKFGEWKVIKEATCNENGEATRECIECDAAEMQELSAGAHKFGDWLIVKEATSTTDGEMHQECSECSAIQVQIIPALMDEEPTVELGLSDEAVSEEQAIPSDFENDKNDDSNSLSIIIIAVLGVIAIGGIASTIIIIRRK